MAINYATLKQLASETTWLTRVQVAIVNAAVAVATDSPATALDVKRDAFARQILRSPEYWATVFALPVALGFTDGTDLVSVTDSEISDRVSAVFNDLIS